MAQFMSDALTGFSQRRSQNSEYDPESPHHKFLHTTLLPNTIKIQKELRGRRYKQVQSKLAEAVMGMHKFQFEQWPPEYDNSQDIYGLPHKSLDEHLESQAAISEDGDNESTIGDFSQAPNNEDGLKPFDDVSVATATTTKTTSSIASNEEDDPLTKEIMHTSIEELLEALILILTHPQKTNKSCEQAIDCVTQLVTKGYISGRAGGLDDPSGSGASQREIPPAKRPQPSLLHRLMEATQKCGESSKETVQLQVIECFKAIMTSPKCSAHEASMLLAIRSVFHIYLVTKSQSCQLKAKACLMEICSSIVRRMEDSPLKQNSLFYTDSYYLMRSLVKLSSKELQGIDDKSTTQANFLTRQIFTTTSVDPLALNNKVLSLELICQIMESAGDNICYGEKFVHLVQSQLCVALLKNCMSNHTQVAFISQKTFLVLVYKFKTHLKDEIQVFMTNIFLRVLQSDNSSFAQKALVLESLRSLCSDPVLLTQIFLNYDCDFDAMNLYKDIVFHLTKLSGKSTAQPLGNMSKKDAEEHFELSLAAIEVVTTILHTFLKALNIPSPNHSEINDTAGSNIRKILGLKDVGQFNLQQFIQEELQHEDEDENFAPVVSRSSSAASLAEAAEASSHLAQGIVDAFDRKRNAEQNFEMGSVKFTLSSKSGLKFFVDNGFVTLDAKEIAIFFIDNKDKLDKTQMGEVLGREPDAAFIKGGDIDAEKGGSGFYFKILHHYIEALEFKELLFDEAIRLFLSGFRLPGEAQKIDRIMEKFAERYTRQNQEVFPNADTAFILAFSVIMLNTDLHNPSIKPERRMTLDGFQRNNRGIGENGSDLPVDFLAGIFERIKKSPFSLKEDDAAREKAAADVMDTGLFGESSFFGTSAEERKREKFKMEREEMMSATEQLIRRRRGKANASEKSLADSVAPADVVKPMFDVTWGPVIGILSQVLECSTDERSIEVCLNGFVYAIRISSHNNMSLARDTFINSLAKFTFLGSIKEMKFKNIESIRTLMTIAVADGEYLGESWGAVLQCISQLARMRMSASGLDSDESFLQIEEKAPKKKKSQTFSVFGGGNTSQQNSKITLSKEMEEMNGRAILESFSEQLIDSVFSSTVKLSARSLGHFIEQLVSVSKAELEGDNKRNITGVQSTTKQNGGSLNQGPSIFSLQKLVEVADFNMDSRPRVIWNQVWEIMADYFAEIGCHRNSMVSVFAIDSLKQLSSKFLEKPEKSERNFQRVFLNPFLLIIQNPGTPHENRELVLQCIDQMVSTKAHNLQSGWKIFFDILMVASCDSSEKIMVLAINILQRLLDEHLSKLCILPASSKKDDAVEDKEKKVDGTEMSTTEKKNRNANAEDFVGMCRASLSFVQHHDSNSRYPVGISMRALCHSAIYADLIAEGRILPPVSGTQSIDPAASGYTYDGLSEVESLEMVLWRPLLKGLADAAKFTASSRAGGVGCLVQRGSVLAIRAILLRHGALFSVEQLVCILQDTIIPSFQKAAENDLSPMISITSESPGISNLDFLAEAMPLPPPIDDPGLLKFEEVARSMDCAPKRALGPAELLLEACFTDMRHGGDGDLTQVYKFARKEMRSTHEGEQPFPDSWISTTAPVALGALTDIASEVILLRGEQGATELWPRVESLIQLWCNGRIQRFEDNSMKMEWAPCEALVRIACREVNRCSLRILDSIKTLNQEEQVIWANSLVNFFRDTLSQSLEIEKAVKLRLVQEKIRAFQKSTSEINDSVASCKDESEDSLTVEDFPQDEVAIEFSGAWIKLVPSLKVRCIAAHFLQQALLSLNESALVPLLSEKVVIGLLHELNRSQEMAENAAKNEDIAHAFQEAILSDWGMDEEDRDESLVNVAKISQTQGSAMFFLTQTAGATNVMIRILSVLYVSEDNEGLDAGKWNHEAYAISYLLEMMKDILTKFAESEAKEGHRIDPNVWRNTAEKGVSGKLKLAVYCTAFASSIECLLRAMLSFDQEHFERQKAAFFPMICRLITVQSDEIRSLVQQILLKKFGPMLDV